MPTALRQETLHFLREPPGLVECLFEIGFCG